jgi:4-amino-4-deoxy-L-arabinose transferase-like glycosyltransferase
MAPSKLQFWFGPAIVLAFAVLLFSTSRGLTPHPSELHNVLAAQRLLETGRPIFEQGENWRGIMFTWLAAFSYEIFGKGIAGARSPVVLLVAMATPGSQ